MATVYSLICWGGLSGKTVSISATTDVVTLAKHGLRNGMKLYPSGTLPAELSVGTPVYARSATIDTFTLHTSAAGAIANTGQVTFAGSSTYAAVVLTSDFWYNFNTYGASTYGGVDKTRYGSAGSERCYDGVKSWRDARNSAALAFDTEVAEVGEAFDDNLTTAAVVLNLPCAVTRIESKINGTRTGAFHSGNPGTGIPNGGTGPNGYCIVQNTYYVNGLEFTGDYTTADGIMVANGTSQKQNTSLFYFGGTGLFNKAKNCIAYGHSSPVQYMIGFNLYGDIAEFSNCIALGCTGTSSAGFQFNYAANKGSVVVNNTSVKNTNGYLITNTADAKQGMLFQNNLAVGNTTNWSTYNSTYFKATGYNAGESGNSPWYKTTDNCVKTMTTSMFVDYTNNDLRPALLTSAQVESGTEVFGLAASDIVAGERPNYMGITDSTDVSAGSFIAGYGYTIKTVGTTDFTLIGASASTVGVFFIATGVGTGSGVATQTPKWDIGAHEFGHGYTRPVSCVLSMTGLVSGSDVKVFTSGTTTVRDSDSSSGTTYSYDALEAGVTVDYTVMKAGKLPIRVTGVALPAGTTSVTISQVDDQNYVASSSLTWNTNFTADTANKHLKCSASTSGRNLYSALIEAWIAQSALNNVAFPFEMNGPGGMILKSGWETRGYSTAGTGYDWNTSTSTLYNITDDGVTYLNASGTRTAAFASIVTQGVPTGKQARFRQSDTGTVTNARSTGNVNQLVQIYGDASHGNFDYTGFMVWKVQAAGYDEASLDLVSTYGTLEGQGYIVPLVPTSNGIADAAGITGISITDHGASPATWNGKAYSLKITDTTGHTGQQIIQWLRHAFEAGGTLEGIDAFGWHDLARTNGSKYKTVRGVVYGDAAGATQKGVYVVQSDGSSAHTDFNLYTADDGTTYSSDVVRQKVTITGITSGSRVQIYDTTSNTELFNGVVAATSKVWTDTVDPVADRAIRIRIARIVAGDGDHFLEANIGTCGQTSGTESIYYLHTPTADDVYEADCTALGTDGETVYGLGEITFTDASPDVINLNISANTIDLREIYVAWCYYAFTAAGIATDIDYIEAIDVSNYALSNMVMKNTSSPTAPLKVTGGYAWDAVSLDPMDLIDTTGGTLFLAPPHVVAYATAGSYAITGDISDVPAQVQSGLTAQGYTSTRAGYLSTIESNVTELHLLAGLDADNPLTVTASERTAGAITQSISGTDTVTVSRGA